MTAVPIDDMRKEVEDMISSSRRIINRTRDLSDFDTFIVPDARTEPRTFFEDMLIMYQNERPNCKWTMHRDLLARYAEKKDADYLVFNIFGEQKKFNVEAMRGATMCYQSPMTIYDDAHLMDFLDREEIPPIVVTSFTLPCDMKLFREGGIISELRFYRSSGYINNLTSSIYVYLKLSNETINELINVYGSNPNRTVEQVQRVETSLMLATSGPLCLNPSPEVSLVTNHLNYEKKLLLHPELKRNALRNLPEEKEKRRALNYIHTTPRIAAMKAMMGSNFFSGEPSNEESMDEEPMEPKEEVKQKATSNLYAAANFDLESMDKKIRRFPPPTRPLRQDYSAFHGVEEKFYKRYCLKAIINEEHQKSLQSAVITITKNDADKLYRGTLTLNSESFSGPEASSNIISRTFLLGTQDAVDKFTEQFIEVYTEAGCKPVVIQRNGSGEETKTEYPLCMRDIVPKDQEEAAEVVAVEPEPELW